MSKIDSQIDTRAVMVLERESQRMSDAAERVRLVVKAMALRHGVTNDRDIESDAID